MRTVIFSIMDEVTHALFIHNQVGILTTIILYAKSANAERSILHVVDYNIRPNCSMRNQFWALDISTINVIHMVISSTVLIFKKNSSHDGADHSFVKQLSVSRRTK